MPAAASPRTLTIRADRHGRGERKFRFTRDEPPCHCVNCGAAAVWCEEGSDDYYLGESFICAACGAEFTWQGGAVADPTKEPREATFRRALQEAVSAAAIDADDLRERDYWEQREAEWLAGHSDEGSGR